VLAIEVHELNAQFVEMVMAGFSRCRAPGTLPVHPPAAGPSGLSSWRPSWGSRGPGEPLLLVDCAWVSPLFLATSKYSFVSI